MERRTHLSRLLNLDAHDSFEERTSFVMSNTSAVAFTQGGTRSIASLGFAPNAAEALSTFSVFSLSLDHIVNLQKMTLEAKKAGKVTLEAADARQR